MYSYRWDRLSIPQQYRRSPTKTSDRALEKIFGHKPPRMNRRRFLMASAATTGLLAIACQPIAAPTLGVPKAIPGTLVMGDPIPPLHLYLPTDTLAPDAPNIADGTGDPSTIFDFDGVVGIIEPFGGTGTDNEGNALYWAADYRFLQGQYYDSNENLRHGTFAFL